MAATIHRAWFMTRQARPSRARQSPFSSGTETFGAGVRGRLLTVADELSAVGGTELAQLRIVEGLASKGWSVELHYVRRGDLWPRWQAATTSTRTLQASGAHPADPIRTALGALGACIGTVRSDAQVVYLHSPGDLPAALLASRATRVPVVVHLHLPPPFRQPEWLNRLIRKAHAVITPSADTAARWVQIAELSGHRISVIPTGIDTNRFVPLPAQGRDAQRRALGLDPGVPVILYAGRIDPTKGLHHLLEGVRRMEEHVNLVFCGAAGDARFAASLRDEAGDLDVTWLDRRTDVTPLLAAADLVVLPSLVHETQGMVLIEAMSCAVPAVASAIGGIPETLGAFPDHLVPPGDPEALAATMDRIVGWRRTTPMLGDASRRWVLGNRSLDRTVSAVSALLTEIRR
jgi:glycosyltransferase involved in cell wall biosynthesis